MAAAHLAHLVLPDTQANPLQNQKSQIVQRSVKNIQSINFNYTLTLKSKSTTKLYFKTTMF